jgi:hypothetical protein
VSVWTLVAVALPVLPMYVALSKLARPDASVDRTVAAAAAPALSLGFASSIYFLLVLVTRTHANAVRLDAVMWLLANLWCVSQGLQALRRPRSIAVAAPGIRRWRPGIAAAAVGCTTLLVVAAVDVWLQWRMNPHGMWDAWAIWNLHARAYFRAAPDWSAVFSPLIGWSNPDYPPLVAVTIARVWAYHGRESTLVPAFMSVLFAGSSLALVIVSAARLRGWTIGLLSGMALLMARTYAFQTACQCADVPIGFFILVAIVFMTLGWGEREPARFFAVAGLAAGCAALTKNEGAPLMLLVGFVALLKAPRVQSLTGAALGAALPLVALTIFKVRLAPSNYLFELQTPAALRAKLQDPARWSNVFGQIADRVPAWGEVWMGALACLAVAAALTARRDRASRHRAATALLLVAAMLVSYGVIYVVTPLPLDWQIATSFDRLFTQIWPALVWAAFQL